MANILTYFPERTKSNILNKYISIYRKNYELFNLLVYDSYIISINNYKTNVAKLVSGNILLLICNSKFMIHEPYLKNNSRIIFTKKDFIIQGIIMGQYINYYYRYRNSIKYKYHFNYDDEDMKFNIYYYFYKNYQYKKLVGKVKNKYNKSRILIPNKYELNYYSKYFHLI